MNKQELAATIWKSANDMRSKIDANEYKDYILGFIFYKFLSDKELNGLKADGWDEDSLKEYLVETNESLIKTCKERYGYFIAYSDLFSTWLKKGTDFDAADVTTALSAFKRNINKDHEKVFENIFDTLDTGLSKLGENSGARTKAISSLINLINPIPMDDKQGYDVLGYIYEYLISNFAANAGKKAGEFYTPHEVSLMMSQIVANHLKDRENIEIYDPACKTGVFLREIAKRLIIGLQDKIPNLQERIDHILHKQLFGIAITELTSLLSRRSLYCSKYPNGKYSISHFDDAEGNVRFRKINHVWANGKCKYCSATEMQWKREEGKETHAYEFIHLDSPEKIFNMKFDVIISNPPYQLSDGGAQASAKPIYQKFVESAKKLQPRYLSMIIPARWMTGGKGLDDFREKTINDKHFTVLHDFANAEDCFSGVDIKGGVCYFLWERDTEKMCDIYRHDTNGTIFSQRYLVEDDDDIFIRYPQLVSIKQKVWQNKSESFETIVSSRKPYGLASDFFVNPAKFGLPPISDMPIKDGYKILGLVALKRVTKYIPQDYPLPRKNGIDKYKLFVTNSYGCGEFGEGPAGPVLATPKELCTETFLEIGNFNTSKDAENCMSYLKTKFFRCLVGIRKQTQHATKQVYHYVPMQDFSKPWTDEELYKKYNLSQTEIDFIESMIKPME